MMQDTRTLRANFGTTKEALKKAEETLNEADHLIQLEQEKARKLKDLLSNSQEELNKKSEELKRCQTSIERLTSQLEQERAQRAEDVKKLERTIEQLNKEKAEADDMSRTALEENRKLQSQCQISAERIREKDGELSSLRSFLYNHETSSDADVRAMLDRINDLAEDVATRTAETAMVSLRDPNPADRIDSYSLAKHTIGDTMTNMLHNSSKNDSSAPVLLRFAWRTSIIHKVDWVVSCFSAPHALLERSKGAEGMLEILTGAVEEEESQLAFGNWRSLTHRIMRSTMDPEDLTGCRQAVVESVMRTSYAAAMVLLKKDCLSVRQFRRVFGPDVEEIVRYAFELASTLKEEVVTKNFVSVYPGPGDVFDNGTMVTEKGDVAINDRVGCTTRLGLSYTFKPAGENADQESKAFVQAQVLTASALRNLVSVCV